MITYEVIELENNIFGYHILSDGLITQIQYFTPGLDGFVGMTREEAESFAKEQLINY
jgi:hypothetical protein